MKMLTEITRNKFRYRTEKNVAGEEHKVRLVKGLLESDLAKQLTKMKAQEEPDKRIQTRQTSRY